jgi:hypothetical protein
MRSIGVLVVLGLGVTACVEPRVNQNAKVLEIDDLQAGQSFEGEHCPDYAEATPCGPDGKGVQFCFLPDEADDHTELEWGVCVLEVECAMMDARECGEEGTQFCEADSRGVPMWGECVEFMEGEGSTPLVVQLQGEVLGFDAAAGASFDLGAECLASDWPQTNTPWLAIDLDRSGSIDGGHELFGSASVLPDGTRARNGFVALAALDTDRDGLVTPRDPAFADIVLWTDHDGDRRSTHWEHTSLAAAGIASLPVAYETRTECDARGNCGRERAPIVAATADGPRAGEIVDVHLACQ